MNMVNVHIQCILVQNVLPSQFWLVIFYFYAEMTMHHGVFVIKCANRGFERLGLLRRNFQLRYSREFFPLSIMLFLSPSIINECFSRFL